MCRILNAHDLVTSPAFVVIKAADQFHDKTSRRGQLWQTDFTTLKMVGWGWPYLSTDQGDFSRTVIAFQTLHDHASRGRHRHLSARP